MSIANGRVGITGLGKYIPKMQVTNEELGKRLNVTPEWIVARTGIKTRHFVKGEESASWISTKAAEQALERAGIQAREIDLVIGCTSTGDYIFPAMACRVQDLLGAKRAGAFDVAASSTGFQVGISLAADRLRCDPSLKHILVVGTAVPSRYLDWNNSNATILFGDGSGAAVLSRVPEGYGVLATEIFCQGEAYEAIRLRGGGSNFPLGPDNVNQGLQHIEMDGVTVGKKFLRGLPRVIDRALEKAGLTREDVDLFIFHQANLRLIEFLMKRMKLPLSKTYTNVEQFGNTADASLPIALCEAWEKGFIHRGDIVAISGVGAGCIFGTTVLRWY